MELRDLLKVTQLLASRGARIHPLQSAPATQLLTPSQLAFKNGIKSWSTFKRAVSPK